MNKIQNNKQKENENFEKLLEKNDFQIPQNFELIKGIVLSASKSEVKLDIGGFMTGVVRGPELYEEDDDYANLKIGDEVEATVIDNENENGEIELSFKYAGQEKAWQGLINSFENKENIKVKITDANRGGIMAKFRQIAGFLPVSQLSPENYPRVNGGDKTKILEKLKSFIGKEFEVKVVTLDKKDDKIIFSEKEVWNEKQKDVISKYKIGVVVDGTISAITNFGVFINFGENLEGLIHISELAWQRIDRPSSLYEIGDKIKAEIISLDKSKIFLSIKKLLKDPWSKIEKKYKVGQIVKGTILKVNPFGLFVSLDDNIHGLAHITQLNLDSTEKINKKFKTGSKENFKISSVEPKNHRLGLVYIDKLDKEKKSDKEKTPIKNSDKNKK